MRYMIFALLALVALSACNEENLAGGTLPTEDPNGNPIDTWNDGPAGDAMPPRDEVLKEGTHVTCENGECVRSFGCQAGYDEFQSQIGPACVKHAGIEEIGSWPTCTKSSDTCDCVMASKTTDGAVIKQSAENAFKCVPESYSNFLVHSGKTGKDDAGEEYSVIA